MQIVFGVDKANHIHHLYNKKKILYKLNDIIILCEFPSSINITFKTFKLKLSGTDIISGIYRAVPNNLMSLFIIHICINLKFIYLL